MKRSMVLFTCLAATVLAFSLQAGEMENPELVRVPITWHQAAMTDGEGLYAELCAVCHGVDGSGGGPAAEALNTPLPDLTLCKRRHDGVFPHATVESAIRGESRIAAHGTVDMPIWGHVFADARPDFKPARRWALAEQRIHNLTSYLESIQK